MGLLSHWPISVARIILAIWFVLGVKLSPARAEPFVYVAGSFVLGIIDTAADALADAPNVSSGHIPLYGLDSGEPRPVGVDPTGRYVYVADGYQPFLNVFEADLNTRAGAVSACSMPLAIAFPPHSHLALVTCGHSSVLAVFNWMTNEAAAPIEIGRGQFAVAVTPDGAQALVTSPNLFGPSTVSIIDLHTQRVIGTVETELSSRGVAIAPDGALAYVTNQNSDSVSVIDILQMRVVDRIVLSGGPIAIAVLPTGDALYVTQQLSGSVVVIDTATRQPLDEISVGTQPIAITLTRNGRKAYVLNKGQGSVSVIDTGRRAVVRTIVGVAGDAASIAIAPPREDGCVGDCHELHQVTVDNVIAAVAIALGDVPIDECRAADVDDDGGVTVDEIVVTLQMALNGCPPVAVTPRPTVSPTPTTTPLENGCAFQCDNRPCVGTCADGSQRYGNCVLSGEDGCQCAPFECPRSCGLSFDPVPTNWDRNTITLTGSVSFVGYQIINAFVTGGAEPVSFVISYGQPFALDVPLKPGLNELRIDAQVTGPPGCHSQFAFDVFVDEADATPSPTEVACGQVCDGRRCGRDGMLPCPGGGVGAGLCIGQSSEGCACVPECPTPAPTAVF